MSVVIGDAQNDGVNRVYVLVRASGIREFTYDKASGTWAQTSEIPIGAELFGMTAGDGQNDGINRLYIAQVSPSRVIEATFDGVSWQTATVANLSARVFRVLVGDARGDGIHRVYSSGQSGVFEFTRQ
jgi:hypothetical protein